jgi:hypothetical protein
MSNVENDMNRLKLIPIILSLLILSSCATPAGKFKESDMAWTKMNLPLNYQAVYRNLNDGFRTCGPSYFPVGNLYTDINEGHFDIYLSDMFGGSSEWVYGRVSIKDIDGDSSAISIGVNNAYDNPLFGKKGGGREMISQWAQGIYECIEEKRHNKAN